eukprot:503689_1
MNIDLPIARPKLTHVSVPIPLIQSITHCTSSSHVNAHKSNSPISPIDNELHLALPNSNPHTFHIGSYDDEDVVLQRHGYKRITKISETLQGELFKASDLHQNRYVAIKRTDKRLFRQQIAVQDDISFVVAENIVQEAFLLRYLTVDHTPIGDYVLQFIDFFESNASYYLVIEYIESEMNLKQFITKCAQYIANGQLSLNEYKKVIKFVLWQLFVTVQWLHTMRCCHLDLCLENIMLSDVMFSATKSGVTIDPTMSIKLCDFGAAESFTTNDFLCAKHGLNVDNEGYLAPNIFNGDPYDARYADNWSLGMVLFECMTVGKHLYGPRDMYSLHSGYYALQHGQLKQYLLTNDLLSYFSADAFSLVSGLLRYDERYRLNGMRILTHQWFKMYAKAYSRRIRKKF